MIARKLLVVIVVFITYTACVKGQSAYINTQRGIFRMTGGPGNCDRQPVSNGCGIDNNVLSLAVYKDTIYYSTWGGELKRFVPGVAGSCEILIDGGVSYNAITVDKNGIIYMATEELAVFNPHTKQLTNLGRMPYYSVGDLVFYQDKLLLAGYDPADWSSGIFEINPSNLSASKLYMSTPPFIGLVSFPVPCNNSRYYGLISYNTENTQFVELDLATKQIKSEACSMPIDVLDAGSTTETGIDTKIMINSITKSAPINCRSDNGSIVINASSPNNPVNYTFLNTGRRQSSGDFSQLHSGVYQIRITDDAGCTKDTSVIIPENIPVGICNDIFIPNAFTPNDDGKNDAFTISVPSGFRDVILQVYNRNGNLVYEGKGDHISWDGRYHGIKQPSSVFIYGISYIDPSGVRQLKKGTLTLLR